VRGTAAVGKPDLARQREVAEAFLTALRGGDFEGLLAVLDPDVVVRLDDTAAGPGAPREIHGAENWAKRTVALSRMFTVVQPALVNGVVGLVWAPGGRLLRVIRFVITKRKIVQVEVIADPARLRGLDVAILDR
jgi:RNA polymerase sigma-70 factor (ECF subfamily)